MKRFTVTDDKYTYEFAYLKSAVKQFVGLSWIFDCKIFEGDELLASSKCYDGVLIRTPDAKIEKAIKDEHKRYFLGMRTSPYCMQIGDVQEFTAFSFDELENDMKADEAFVSYEVIAVDEFIAEDEAKERASFKSYEVIAVDEFIAEDEARLLFRESVNDTAIGVTDYHRWLDLGDEFVEPSQRLTFAEIFKQCHTFKKGEK